LLRAPAVSNNELTRVSKSHNAFVTKPSYTIFVKNLKCNLNGSTFLRNPERRRRKRCVKSSVLHHTAIQIDDVFKQRIKLP